MAGLGWLRTGTITVTNGSKAVTGTDTIWGGGVVNPGDIILLPNGALGEVESVGSNAALTLKQAYTGATASAQPYAIIRMLPSGNVAADLAAALQALIQRYGITLDQLMEWLDGAGAVSFTDGTTTLAGLHGLRKLMADIDASIKLRDERRIVLGAGADNGVDQLQLSGSAYIPGGMSPVFQRRVTGDLAAGAWTPVFSGAVMPTGVYMMHAYVNNFGAGGVAFMSTFAGLMCWYADPTNSAEMCEIVTHFAGHAPRQDVPIKFRTVQLDSGGSMRFEIFSQNQLTALGTDHSKIIDLKFIRLA